MKNVLIILFLLFNTEISAQYLHLNSSGKIPKNFLIKPEEKYSNDIININSEEEKKVRENSKEFFFLSNHIIDYYFRSGRVTFNNELNSYINEIAEKLLFNDQKIRSQIRFYIINDYRFNAFTTHDGTIFINLGLIAKAKSEAQLAFILAHEISHFVSKDNLDSYLKNQSIKEGKDSYKNLNYDIKLIKMSEYSKEQELSADKYGLENFFIRAGYNTNAAEDLLSYTLIADYPIGKYDDFFKTLNIDSTTFPANYFLTKYDSLVTTENYKDSLSTHPNIQKRKENIIEILKNYESNKSGYFINSEDKFYKIKKIAMYEIARLFMQQLKYSEALCAGYYIRKKYGDRKFSEILIGHALMQLAHYKAKDDYIYQMENYKNTLGSSQLIYYFINKISDKNLSAFALKYNWELKKKYPNNKETELITDQLFKILVFDLNLSTADFNKTYDSDSEYYKNSFINITDLKDFYNNIKIYEAEKERIKNEKLELIKNKEKRREIAEKNRLIQKKGYALGIDTIVIINPLSISSNSNKKTVIEFKKSEDNRYSLIEAIKNISNKINLKTHILDLKYMDDNEVEKYNDYCLLSEWFSEKCYHESDEYLMYSSKFLQDLRNKYRTKYFAWVALIKAKDGIVKEKSTSLDLYLFDIETGKMILSQRKWINAYNTETFVNKGLENILLQIKTKRN